LPGAKSENLHFEIYEFAQKFMSACPSASMCCPGTEQRQIQRIQERLDEAIAIYDDGRVEEGPCRTKYGVGQTAS